MENESFTFLIKIYSGPHAGAEIQLQRGVYVLGRAADCDIVLNDAAIAERHLELIVDVAGISGRLLARPGYYQGRELTQTNLTVGWHQVITLGTTHFCCGHPGQDWPIIQLPQLQGTQPTAECKEDTHAADSDAVASASTQPTESVFSKSTEITQMRRLLTHRRLSFGGVSTLFVGGLLVFSMGNTYPVRSIVSTPTPAEQVRYLTEQLGLEQIQVAETNKKLKVSGYVESAAQKTALEDALQSLDTPLQQHIWITDELADSAAAVLEALGIEDLQIKANTSGELVMQGYVGDEALWRTSLNTLRQDIPGVRTINDSAVETAAMRAELLRSWLRDQSINNLLTVTVEGDQLHVKGTLGSQELLAWGKVQQRFRSRYGHHPVVQARIHETRNAIEIDIKSVSVGATAFFITKDDRQYMEGARLPNGYYIKTIAHDRIVLTRNNRDYAYYLGGK
ncbi:MAG: type III secretion system inner membrane ring subunit SctD [Candidatus Competibacteraceae bacterium]|jgi:type III secretion protein D|nr:type III secretion system inner membrane ring subunit SctD [Candidatus Competibacteraceae bacterium]